MRRSTEGLWGLGSCLELLDGFVPRLLSQIDRDPDSPTFGSCDRGFWMYRLHDFDSGVLQQAGASLAALAVLARTADLSDVTPQLEAADPGYLEAVAHAVNRRTARLLRANGFLDEYYPGEQSYPGTVFAAYATLWSACVLDQRDVIDDPGLLATAERLLGRSASQAANQDVAAAAFLALYAKTKGWSRPAAHRTIDVLLAGPDGTRRCLEYGGGDLGYASVSLNYLACMLLDESHDVGGQVDELAGFLADFTSMSGQLGGEFASRSTTYWLPLGPLVAARRDSRLAARLDLLDLRSAYERLDDRYLMHYCLPSLARAALELAQGGGPLVDSPAPRQWAVRHYEARGLLSVAGPACDLFVGLSKGGAFDLELASPSDGASRVIDAGYRITRDGAVFATSVIDPEPSVRVEESEQGTDVVIRSAFRRYRSLVASPNKTLALRLARNLGPNLNSYFKNRLIKQAEALPGPELVRKLRVDRHHGRLEVEDEIVGLGREDLLSVSPPVCLRLVPSARFWQPGEAAAFEVAQLAQTRRTRRFELG